MDWRKERIASDLQPRKRFYLSLFAMFVAVAFIVGAALESSRLFERQELQTINFRFESRPWLVWSQESLRRLNLQLLWEYHQRREVPRVWYNWDYTLSWLVENNHPPVKNNIVIFNRELEDEPPDAALASFPWMQPLAKFPLPRATVAAMVDFLASHGAAAIILDSDFPQHAEGDRQLAQVIHKWSSGQEGATVPIFMVETVNSGSDSRIVELGTPTRPVGILDELKKLEPDTDVEDKYLGTTCVIQDSDQVVRGLFVNRNVGGKSYKSIVVKALQSLGRPVPADLPSDAMDIDFAVPPKSDFYPTRPLVYLLDPERQKDITNPASGDVQIKGAVVFFGDGVTDVYSTSYTGDGNNQMAGTEILAQAMDTISRHSWPVRLSFTDSLLYLLGISIAGGAFWVAWKALQSRWLRQRATRKMRVVRLVEDMCACGVLLAAMYLIPCIIFSCWGFICPMFVPPIMIGFATLAAIVLEREQERAEKFQLELKAAEEKLVLTQEKYEAEIKRREAEAKSREILVDKKRRHEFVRRINHDLNAPVSVLNWTVSELQMMNLENDKAREKVSRLVKSSDKLCELIDQLVHSYDYENVPNEPNANAVRCDLTEILHDCVDGQVPHATVNGAILEWKRPDKPMWVRVNQLELVRVIDNLIRNAVRHNPEGTRVNVTAEANGRFYIVAITDDGKGIATEHLDHIFEPGYRVEPIKKTGQGLGLDIAKTLVEGMSGEITVTSVLRKGTTFKLKIPMCDDENSPSEKTDFAAGAGSTLDRDQAMVLSDGTVEQKSEVRDGNGNSRSGEEHD